MVKLHFKTRPPTNVGWPLNLLSEMWFVLWVPLGRNLTENLTIKPCHAVSPLHFSKELLVKPPWRKSILVLSCLSTIFIGVKLL